MISVPAKSLSVTKYKRIVEIYQNEKGFSLVELVIAMIIFVIFLAGILLLFEFGLTSSKRLQTRSVLNTKISTAMEKMLRQIRCANKFTAPVVPGGMADNPIMFTADVRGDGFNRDVMFYRTTADNLLYTCEKEPLHETEWTYNELAKYVTALTFTYYDSEGISLGNAITEGNRKLIRNVEISITARRTLGSDVIEITRTGTVTIRSNLSFLFKERNINV
jgi:prepilin-type N-terminal cleavage/methylation domain-containing protein